MPQAAIAEDPNPDKPVPVLEHHSPITYNLDLFNTGLPFGTGNGIPGTTAFHNIGNSTTWEYYRFCGNAGATVSLDIHRTTSAMDPAMQTCEGTTGDSTGVFAFGGCGPSMGPFIGSADDNNGIPHGVGGFFADPRNVFVLPATDQYTLMVFDFIGMGPGPTVPFEIHVDGVSPCMVLDIKPGSDTNPINTRSNGVIPVALLGGVFLNVTDVDPATLTFGPSGASPAHSNDPHYEDVNADGFTDLVAHFRTQETGIAVGDTRACLSGNLVSDPIPFTVCDSVVVR